MTMLRIYVAGLAVLLGAIVMNVLAVAIGLATWYSFLTAAGDAGAWTAIRRLSFADILFLLFLYPGLLGGAAYAVLRAWPR